MIRDVRLPRVICVLVTGGILGMTGAMMQGVTRNPIAEPSLLGISQGATLFVALLYASGIGATAGNTLLAALLGAFFSGVPVLIFTMKNAIPDIHRQNLQGAHTDRKQNSRYQQTDTCSRNTPGPLNSLPFHLTSPKSHLKAAHVRSDCNPD